MRRGGAPQMNVTYYYMKIIGNAAYPHRVRGLHRGGGLLGAEAAADVGTGTVGPVGAKASSAAIEVKAIAEVETQVSLSGREAIKLLPPIGWCRAIK